MSVVSIIFLVFGIYSFLLTVSNILTLRKIKASPLLTKGPLISVCIPARNEEKNIGNCLESMMAQTYRNIEILVLDDDSSDKTAEIIREYMKKDSRIRYLKGKPLAGGWKGKTYAMQQMLDNSHGEYVFFTDADTIHTPKSISYGFSIASQYKADFISGYPKEDISNYGASLVVSAMCFNTCLFIPMALQQKLQKSAFAMSIGQYLFVRRSALLEIGGFDSFKDQIADDVNLVRTLVRHKHKAVFADLKEVLSCRMYSDFKPAFQGIGRSILGVIPAYLFPALILAILLLLASALSGITSLVLMFVLGYSQTLLFILIGSFLLWFSWMLGALFHGFPLKVAASQPLAFLMTVALYVYGLVKKKSNQKLTWKGREV